MGLVATRLGLVVLRLALVAARLGLVAVCLGLAVARLTLVAARLDMVVLRLKSVVVFLRFHSHFHANAATYRGLERECNCYGAVTGRGLYVSRCCQLSISRSCQPWSNLSPCQFLWDGANPCDFLSP